tara:strand:- start:93 stop:566 length:474 start_codon:yes stop_codon:yes gene_type:complete
MKVPSLKFLIVIFLFLNACGFKVVKQADLVNFRILEIKGDGDKRINFKIKNKLISSASQDERKLVNISLITKKNKTVKEKNIKNEVQKYQIEIKVNVELKLVGSNFTKNFSVSDSNEYNVGKQHSITLRNEKKAIESSSNKISEEILDKIIENLNDI